MQYLVAQLREDIKGVSIFKIPVAKDEENKNWVRQHKYCHKGQTS